MLSLGVSPDRIVFANPCKRPADLRYAAERGVALSTFDTESELVKTAHWQRDTARVLLRIRADDPTARCQLGNKYGAEEHDWAPLFVAAQVGACGGPGWVGGGWEGTWVGGCEGEGGSCRLGRCQMASKGMVKGGTASRLPSASISPHTPHTPSPIPTCHHLH